MSFSCPSPPGKQWADDYSSLVTAALLQHVGGSLVVMPEGCAKKFSSYVAKPLFFVHADFELKRYFRELKSAHRAKHVVTLSWLSILSHSLLRRR